MVDGAPQIKSKSAAALEPTGLYGRYSVKVWEGACPRWQWVSH
ncbi:hypothetical protein SAMN04489799_5678 [Pseudomonas azotoformans]|nr:hypothetical protein SAMN04489799_5678 [Pseudomonas azotoformans]